MPGDSYLRLQNQRSLIQIQRGADITRSFFLKILTIKTA